MRFRIDGDNKMIKTILKYINHSLMADAENSSGFCLGTFQGAALSATAL